ncbi:MAG: Wzz/FepE/Etk N-terminal domain-containing protein [Pseudomonadota bacterium]
MTAPAPSRAFRPAAPAEAAAPPAVAELVSVLSRRWLAPALGGALCLGLAAAILSAPPPRYVAQAEILLEARAPRVMEFDEVLPAPAMDAQAVQSQIRLVQSQQLLARVVAKLRLGEDPEFGAERPPGRLERLRTALRDLARERLGWAPAAPPPDPPEWDAGRRAVAALRARLEVAQQDVSRVIAIRVESRDPAKAALIANAVADQYIVDQLEAKFEATRRAADWLAERLEEAARRLEEAEAAAEAQRARLAAGRGAGLPATRRRMAELGTALAKLEGGGPTPRREAQIAALRRSIAALEAEAAERSRGDIRLRQLEREAEALAALHDSVLARLKETRAQAGLERPDARLIAEAVPPLRPAGPDARLVLGFALLGGLGLGGAVAFLRESSDGALHSVEQAERETGLPVLAALPKARAPRRGPAAGRPGSPLAEAARDLRAALLAGAEGPLVIAVVSPGRGEGRSLAAALLAESCAQLGRRTALVDADIRDPAQGARYGVAGGADLVSVLEGETPLTEALWREPGTGLTVLPADPAPAARADLLATPALGELLETLRARFEVIVLDTPGLLAVADGRLVAALADRTAMLARWGGTRRADLRAGLRLLEDVGAPAWGVALTGAPRRADPRPPRARAGGRYGRFTEDFED